MSAVSCQLLVDSGCCILVCPVGFASEQGLTRDGSQQLLAPNVTKIRGQGIERSKSGLTVMMYIHFVVAAVRRPILSVSMLLACGWEVSSSNDVLHVCKGALQLRGDKLQGIRLSSGVAHGMDSQMRRTLCFLWRMQSTERQSSTRQPVGT